LKIKDIDISLPTTRGSEICYRILLQANLLEKYITNLAREAFELKKLMLEKKLLAFN
jgi:hypothetical protein